VPAVLGHEAAGVVEAVGKDVTNVMQGDHVVTCLSVFCGHCEFRVTGHLTICSNTAIKMQSGKAKRLRWKGEHLSQFQNLSSFAAQLLVHENAVVKIRGTMMGSKNFRLDIPRLVEFHMQGRMKLDQLVSNRLKLDQINDGFSALQRGGIARNVVVFD
jgi:Zn-dependent alcohol dehydrogenase